jgi:hypothetical protein
MCPPTQTVSHHIVLRSSISAIMSEAEVNHGNVLSAHNLSRLMISSLPKSSEPQLRNAYDAIALLCHACMLAVGFRLTGLGEDHKIGESKQLLQT